jgi:hypothetical protein
MGEDQHYDLSAGVRPPYPFRVHQQEALDTLQAAADQGRKHAWVVLPPAAGKTSLAWRPCAGWAEFLPTPDHPARPGDGRDLTSFVTAMTYQSLATFDPDSEVEEEGDEQPLLDRLHPNGRALVAAMRARQSVGRSHHDRSAIWGRTMRSLSARATGCGERGSFSGYYRVTVRNGKVVTATPLDLPTAVIPSREAYSVGGLVDRGKTAQAQGAERVAIQRSPDKTVRRGAERLVLPVL